MESGVSSFAFILVPGAFCPGAYFEEVAHRLTANDHEVVLVDNPSVRGTHLPPLGMYDDADNIRAHALKFVDAGKKVVVAANSYGGFIATEAMRGLTDDDLKARSSDGRVCLVYVASLLAPAGLTCAAMLADVLDMPDLLDKPASDFEDPPPAEGSVASMSDLPEEVALKYGRMARPRSVLSHHQELTYEGWRYVPVTYVITENDRLIPPEVQQQNVDEAIASGLVNIKKVSLRADHCAMISHPDEISEILLDAAKDP